MNRTDTMPTCRLAACKGPSACTAAGECLSISELAHEYRQFLTNDAMPSLRAVLSMIDKGEPIAHVRVEIQSLLMRAARTV